MATRAPLARKACAIPLPMPLEPPTTSTCLPLKSSSFIAPASLCYLANDLDRKTGTHFSGSCACCLTCLRIGASLVNLHAAPFSISRVFHDRHQKTLPLGEGPDRSRQWRRKRHGPR